MLAAIRFINFWKVCHLKLQCSLLLWMCVCGASSLTPRSQNRQRYFKHMILFGREKENIF